MLLAQNVYIKHTETKQSKLCKASFQKNNNFNLYENWRHNRSRQGGSMPSNTLEIEHYFARELHTRYSNENLPKLQIFRGET